jgi:hypothetical protein
MQPQFKTYIYPPPEKIALKSKNSYLRTLKISFFLLVIFTANSCKKPDVQKEQKAEISSSESFFSKTSVLEPSVERIYSILQFQDSKNPFVEEFVKKQGVPLWNYAIIQERENSYGTITSQSINSNSTNQQSKDTIVKIPLQLIGYKTVHGYLWCKISNNKIQLLVKDGRSYKDYGYMQNNNSSTSAEALSAELMSINNKIFGINYFEITDSKLFGNNQSKKYASFNKDSINANKVSPNSVLCPGGISTVTITTESEDCPVPGKCKSDGTCDGCGRYCTKWTFRTLSICNQDGPESGTNGTGTLVWTLDNTVPGVIPVGVPTPPGWIPTPTDPCASSSNGGTTTTVCGMGWSPVNNIPTQNPQDPCERKKHTAQIVNNIYSKANIDAKLATIAVSSSDVEKGFPIYQDILISPSNPNDTSFKSSFSPGEVSVGTKDSIEIIYFFNKNTKIDVGTLHTHPQSGYSAQSALDIYEFIKNASANPHWQCNFVAAANGSQYAVTINDMALATDFLTTRLNNLDTITKSWKEGTDIEKAFEKARRYYRKKFKNNSNQENLAYEMAMAAVLDNSGVTLNKKDTDGDFKPLVIKTTIIPKRGLLGSETIPYSQECQ